VTPSFSDRTRYGFLIGGLSLALVFALWISSRTTEGWTTLAEEEMMDVSTGTFSRAGSLYVMLRNHSVAPADAVAIGKSLKKILDPRSLRGSDVFEMRQDKNGAFRRLTITRTFDQYVVEKDSATLSSFTRKVPLERTQSEASGRINSSLWESLSEQGLAPELIMQLSDIFAWNMDFLTECRQGDRFAILYGQDVAPDGKVAGQRIEAAIYDGEVTGRQTAFLFGDRYYDENGDSLRKAFLRAPLNFRRISSGFTRRRYHPVLRYFRPHLGIDYAAPTGTPVVSVGDGTVVFKGWQNAYGKHVRIRHNGTYTTYYGHFSRYARGLRLGQRVKQGQVIGYVGSTGWSTGPHLDFRVVKNGRFVNFLTLKFPPDQSVPSSQKADFAQLMGEQSARLEERLREESANAAFAKR
jgi:murein DD-endopeptidase MepM/ murein hydrolase activator NlpD